MVFVTYIDIKSLVNPGFGSQIHIIEKELLF